MLAKRELTAGCPKAEWITCHPADFVDDELPSRFEMVLECDVNVHSQALCEKLRGALNPGGRLVLVQHFAVAGVADPEPYWTFLDALEDPDSLRRTVADVRGWLTKAGFHDLSERSLSDGSVLIMAHKKTPAW